MKFYHSLIALGAVLGLAAGAEENGERAVRAKCPNGYHMLYLDSEQMNPTCILLLMDNKYTFQGAVDVCDSRGGFLAEPEGGLHHEVYELIVNSGLADYGAVFWIGGSDAAKEGDWRWIRDNRPMPMGTPHWDSCDKGQPNYNDRKANYGCVWPPNYHWFSCTNNLVIRAMCQTLPIY